MSKKAEPVVDRVERPRFAARVINGHVVGDDPWSQEVIDKLPTGRLMFEVDQETAEDGVRAHIMAGINLLFQNLPDTGPGTTRPTPRHLRREILRKTGFVEPVHHRVDGFKLEARSMAKGLFDFEELQLCLEAMRLYCVETYNYDPFQAWSDEKDAEAANRSRRR